MMKFHRDLRVILIGGPSHAGKSTLAQSLATHLGWDYRSADKGLAPHPGRPWPGNPGEVPKHVADHYLSLSPDELIADVLWHYRKNVWPLVKVIVTSHATDPNADRLILEGSAILPELFVTLTHKNADAIWLTASNELFEQRIYRTSQYETRTPIEKRMIDKFLERTWLYNELMMQNIRRMGLVSM
jgi:2-phosphoglycerate kinase